MSTVAFILGWLTGVLCMFALGLWASRRALASGGQVVAVVAHGPDCECEDDEPDDLPPTRGGDPLAITCRACDAPPGIGCAVLRTGLDRDKPHLVRMQDVGAVP